MVRSLAVPRILAGAGSEVVQKSSNKGVRGVQTPTLAAAAWRTWVDMQNWRLPALPPSWGKLMRRK